MTPQLEVDEVEDLDPRVVRSRRSVLDAAGELLLLGGVASVTIDAVVTRSGVARTTIYRHWPTRDDLLAATFEDVLPDLPQPPEGLPFEDTLLHFVRAMVATGSDEHWWSVLPSLIEQARLDRQFEELKERRYGRQLTAISDVLQQGIDQGVLRADLDLTLASLSLSGPLLAAAMISEVALDDALADRFVEMFLDGHRR